MRTDALTVTPDTSVRDLVHLLRDHGISGVPVVTEKGRVAGTVSVSDLVWLCDAYGTGDWGRGTGPRALSRRTVGEVMTPDVFGIARDADLVQLAAFFARTGLRRAVVVEGDRLAGVVSATDLLGLIVDRAPEGDG